MAKGKASKKIRKPVESPEVRRMRLVASKAQAIGMPAAQLARGDHVEVDVPLRDGGKVVSMRTLLNRGGTAVARWHRSGDLTDTQVRAIEHVQALWERAGTVAGLVFDSLKVPGGVGGAGMAQHLALSELHELKGKIPSRY